MIKVFVNEKQYEFSEGVTLDDIKQKFKPTADLVILNGFPISVDNLSQKVLEGDRIVLIKKGEIPSEDELETLMVARHTPGVHKKIKNSSVGIAGLGGLGSNVAIALARVGIGKLVLVDFDVVEPSNLNRQHYFLRHIGLFKTEVMKQMIYEINPYVNVVVHTIKVDETNIAELFSDIDILVEAFDTDIAKRMLIENFQKIYPKKSIISASGVAGYYSSNTIRVRKITPYFYVVGDEEHSAMQGVGLMSPRVGIVAHMQANMVLRVIMSEDKP